MTVAAALPFLLCGLSAFSNLVWMFVYLHKWKQVGGRIPILIAGWLAISLFALGTVFDNFRLFAGAFPREFPAGIFDLRGETEEREMQAMVIYRRDGLGGATANYNLTWISFFMHECMGGLFVLIVVMLWEAFDRTQLPGAQRHDMEVTEEVDPRLSLKELGWEGKCYWAVQRILLYVVCPAAVVTGTIGFALFTAKDGMQLRYTADTDNWRWSSVSHAPTGLVGVFSFAFSTLILGGAMCRRSCKRFCWFLIANVICVLGQGASSSASIAYLSNFLEQLSLWTCSLLALQFLHLNDPSEEKIFLCGSSGANEPADIDLAT